MKDMIISGGENIYPAELERILREHPAIKECAVIGRADPRWGAVPVAVVVPRLPSLPPEEILNVFAGRIARYKIPKAVLYVEALPRNVLGKVELTALRALIKEEPCAVPRSSPP